MHSLGGVAVAPSYLQKAVTGVKGTGSRACPPVGSHPPPPSCVSLGKLLNLSAPQKNGDDDTCLLECLLSNSVSEGI